jgi:hypothetical protein
MLMPLAFNPHGGALAKMAVKMIAEIDAKDAAPAVPAAKSGGR